MATKERLIESPNCYTTSDSTVARLRKIAKLIDEELRKYDAKAYQLPETALGSLVKIGRLLALPALLPEVECWCVVQTRPSPFSGDKGKLTESVWSGHTNAAQANDFARAHGARRQAEFAKHPWWGKYNEKWTAERRFIRPDQIMNPELKASDYMKRFT